MKRPNSKFRNYEKITENILAWFFGILLLIMSVVVGLEVVLRKTLNISLQGADELSGYVLAIGSTVTFGLALIGRNHIRVDLLYEALSRKGQTMLNLLAIVSLCTFAVFMMWMSIKVLQDTISYGSTAPTSWGTPLLYPQSAWIAGLFIFSMIAFVIFLRAVLLLSRGQIKEANLLLQPKCTKEELDEELESIANRQHSSPNGEK